MTTLVIKDNSLRAHQFLEFARTLPYIDIVEDSKIRTQNVKKSVAATLSKSEQGKDLIACENANDMFRKLGI